MEQAQEIELARLDCKPGAFDRFVEHFRAKIFNYSRLMCGHREDAEEMARETLLKVFESLISCVSARERAWLFRIAQNTYLMKRRKSIHAPARELLDKFRPSASRVGGHMR